MQIHHGRTFSKTFRPAKLAVIASLGQIQQENSDALLALIQLHLHLLFSQPPVSVLDG